MFKRNNNQNMQYPEQNFYESNQMQRLFYTLEELNRKQRNLNNRLRRVENFLGLRMDDKFDDDLFYDEG
ncbi:MAG: hypothetical protein R3Y60_05445 [bacterium]